MRTEFNGLQMGDDTAVLLWISEWFCWRDACRCLLFFESLNQVDKVLLRADAAFRVNMFDMRLYG